MGNKHTADGRWIVGNGNSGDDYKGFLHWRECYICLTEDGATEDSVNYLNALKDYAIAHYALGEPIMPPSMTVWVVANGKATAVQADDVKVEDGDYTICGITYSDGAWDYSNAGQGQGGGGLPDYSEASEGDVLSIDSNGDPAWTPPSGGGGGAFYVTITALPNPETGDTSIISDKTYAEIDAAMTAGTPVIAKMVSEGFFAPMLAQKMGTTIAFLMLGFAPTGQSSMLMAAVITMASDGTNGMNYISSATMTPMGG